MIDAAPIQQLTRRLAACPQIFLEEPRIDARAYQNDSPDPATMVHVNAVVADLLRELGAARVLVEEVEVFHHASVKLADRNWLRVVLVACWLLHDRSFLDVSPEMASEVSQRALHWLKEGLRPFTRLVSADACVEDPDRREELARRCLQALKMLPAGESPMQAEDRLATLNIVEQERVMLQTQERARRAEALRQKMREKAAREAAARWTRE